MGALLSLKRSDSVVNTDIFVDFENAKPTEQEAELHGKIAEVLEQAEGLLGKIKSYTGQGEAIQKAISKPSKETEETAWSAVVPQVSILKSFYDYSFEIERILPEILKALCDQNPLENLEHKQAIAKQFADLFHFVLLFDDLKMTTPSIQNDFSYYRRALSRMKMSSNEEFLSNLEVKDETANKMSLYYAVPTPMLNSVTTTTTNFVESNTVPKENVTECLATMAAICNNAVNNPSLASRFEKPETSLFVLRVMVGVIILYDHVHPQGAFTKNSAINIKSSIKLIQTKGEEHKDGLLNALRYTTKHLNDEDTPKDIKKLFQ